MSVSDLLKVEHLKSTYFTTIFLPTTATVQILLLVSLFCLNFQLDGQLPPLAFLIRFGFIDKRSLITS